MVGKPNKENRKAVEQYGHVQVVGTVPVLKKVNRGALLDVFRKHFDRRAFHA
jgi:hypothetical protein